MEQNPERQQELIFKLSMFEQQIQQLQQQLQAIEQGINEMSSLSLGLDELAGGKGKDIFASVGKGIFVKAKLISEELTVDVGGKNFVKKTVPETKELIGEQIKKLEDVKKDLNDNLEKIGGEMQKILIDAQEMEKKEK